MNTRLFLNDANTIFAIDGAGPDFAVGNSLLRPLLRGSVVTSDAVQTLLQTYGGTWVTQRGIKRYPRRERLRCVADLERHATDLLSGAVAATS